MSVMLVTSLGEIVVDLFTDRCPLTCKNFLKLCKIKYYNGCLFHTIQKDFTAQTGDPTGTGSSGDSLYKFLYGDQARFFGDEIHLDVKHSKIGTLAMASAGENLNASQFYITLREDVDYLDGKHTVFGEVAEGLETLTRINEAYVDEKNRPYKNIRIKHTYIIDDPFEDPPLLAELIPDASPEGKPKDEVDDDVRLEDDWIPMDEQLNPQELQEVLREKAAHTSAVLLETIGDIPQAEMKPPENVLFVCKLNPVTEDDDLHTIFSRFGVVTSAEVIRDHKTGDSLCYAFIEFEDKDACEEAYFKMDNALIDDRRIHVDFSQSVAKLWFQYKGKGRIGGGAGCFKCGSFDHIAKDCPGGPTATGQPLSKYMLKDDNTQRGGDRSTRYEMVFDEDEDDGGPRHSKRRRDHKAEQSDDKQNNSQRDERRRDTHDRPRRYEKSKSREDEGYARRQISPHRRGAKDEYPDRNGGDERERSRRHGSGDREKKDGDDARHGHTHMRDTIKYEKKRVDDVGHGDRRNENEIRKRNGNEDVRRSHRDRHDFEDDKYNHKHRGEERRSDKRSSRGDDYRGTTRRN
ncbi:peptidyl-prolyl cis-trans isomerase CYP59-like [Salvia splendens]|uniref:peptidyl-prolyl cis-trans isomerase CYP59-like n=1 Tax=Salvia splendens TaxID=180675 RepID=UPI00110259AE|nr:peptidyl-prolyl cis-trans isomerase CYP59-like [Salvia splendens]